MRGARIFSASFSVGGIDVGTRHDARARRDAPVSVRLASTKHHLESKGDHGEASAIVVVGRATFLFLEYATHC